MTEKFQAPNQTRCQTSAVLEMQTLGWTIITNDCGITRQGLKVSRQFMNYLFKAVFQGLFPFLSLACQVCFYAQRCQELLKLWYSYVVAKVALLSVCKGLRNSQRATSIINIESFWILEAYFIHYSHVTYHFHDKAQAKP